ncbi:MAG: fructose-6-phosphate aldolase, partial [Candidatus Dadabacteria bacterium]
MEIFLDTGNVDEIREAADLGIVSGVTTNPSLIAKSGRPREEVLQDICDLIDGPISGEVIATEADAMIVEGRELAAIHPNIVIKLPMTRDGLKACKVLADETIRVNMTLIFQPLQALLCARAGAAFVSPFIGRLDDIGHDGMDLIRQ